VLSVFLNPLNAELNPICHLLALLGAHLIFHVSRIRVKMDKIEYRVVIKFFVKEGLTPNEIHSKFINFCGGTLLLRFQQLRNGLPSLNVAVSAMNMIHSSYKFMKTTRL
jgi:hypothetical protein